MDELEAFSLPPRGAANLIEACRRLVGSLEEADEEEEAAKGARKSDLGGKMLIWIAAQLPVLKR